MRSAPQEVIVNISLPKKIVKIAKFPAVCEILAAEVAMGTFLQNQ